MLVEDLVYALATIHKASYYYYFTLLTLFPFPVKASGIMRSPDNAFDPPLLRTPITHTFSSLRPCNDLERRLRLDGTSPTAPTTPSATASQAGDDDVEAGDDTGDDSL